MIVECTVLVGETHTPCYGSFYTVSLAVNEVAPATNGLTDKQSQATKVSHGPCLDFTPFREDEKANNRAYNTAVNSEAAFPNFDNIHQVILVVFPAEYYIVCSRADNCQRHGANKQVNNIILGNTEFFGALYCVYYCQQETYRNNNAVPMYTETSYFQIRFYIELKILSQKRKADSRILQLRHILFIFLPTAVLPTWPIFLWQNTCAETLCNLLYLHSRVYPLPQRMNSHGKMLPPHYGIYFPQNQERVW